MRVDVPKQVKFKVHRGRLRPTFDKSSEVQSYLENAIYPSYKSVNIFKCEKGAKVGPYILVKLLGKGSFGEAWSSFDERTNENFCLKFSHPSEEFRQAGLSEASILKEHSSVADSMGIVKQYDHFIHGSRCIIVMELLAHSLHYTILQTSQIGCSINLTRKLMLDVLVSLIYLEARNLIHSDVKPDNIVLRTATKTRVKLIDFGACLHASEGKYLYYIQSRHYRAPEVIMGLGLTPAADVWSFGCVLFETLTGTPLFKGIDESDMLKLIYETIGTPPLHLMNIASERRSALPLWNDDYSVFLPGSFGVVTFKSTKRKPGMTMMFPNSNNRLWKRLYENRLAKNHIKPEIDWENNNIEYQDLFEVFSSIFVLDPQFRLTATELIALPFFNNIRSDVEGCLMQDERTWEYYQSVASDTEFIYKKHYHNLESRNIGTTEWKSHLKKLNNIPPMDINEQLNYTKQTIKILNDQFKNNKKFEIEYSKWVK